jgi:zinc/manganese transport system permease protein
MNLYSIVFIILTAASLPIALQHDPLRSTAFILMATAMSSTSFLVYYKRLEFLAAGSVHTSLLAVTLGYIGAYYVLGGVESMHGYSTVFLLAITVGLVIIYLIGVLIRRGVSQEKASAIGVSLATTLSVIAIQYALTTIPIRYSLSSIILGEPLLISRDEAIIGIAISLSILVLSILFHREIVETSIDPISASLTGIKTGVYDFLVYTLIGFSSIGLLKFAGYVMEHVLLLLPATIAVYYSGSLREHYVGTLVIGISSSSIGYSLSLLSNTPPAGLTGLILILLLTIGLIRGISK